MQRWKISFWTPGNMPKDDGRTFGCASYGICANKNWINPEESAVAIWEHQPEGIVLSGTYNDILEALKSIEVKPKAAIALFSKTTGIEDFIESFSIIKEGVPVLGGMAVPADNQALGEVLPKAEDAALFLITEDGFVVESCNIHIDTEERVKIKRSGKRNITEIKASDEEWQESLKFFKSRQQLRGMGDGDFETLTFSDTNGRNLHCSAADNSLKVGADLPEEDILVIRETSRKDGTESMASFLSAKNTLVCGCAGLRSLLDKELQTGNNSLAGFLYGEAVTIDQKPVFGNLMMARLRKE